MKGIVTILFSGVMGMFLLHVPLQADPPPPYTISVYGIKFNHNTGSDSSDGITIKDSGGSTITAPEWDSSTNDPVAYIRSSAKTIQVRFSCTEDTVTQVSIWATKSSGNILGDISSQTVSFDNGYSEYVSFDIASGDVPTTVAYGTVTWEWEWYPYYGTFTGSMGYTGPHEIYVVNASPVSPESEPNVTILGYACDWADGESTGDGICISVFSDGFSNHYNYNYDCHLFSSDFVRLVSSLGVSASQHYWASKYWRDAAVGDMEHQRTKLVDPVGPSIGLDSLEFNYHQWSEAAGSQRDPSTKTSKSGSWGGYEDDLFTQYRVCTSEFPDFDSEWVPNQSGQSSGCEVYPTHCDYDSTPILYDWVGPDY